MKKSGKVKIEDFVLVDRYVSLKNASGEYELVYVGNMLVRPEYIVSFSSPSNNSGYKGYICVRMKDGYSFYISEETYKNIWEGIDL